MDSDWERFESTLSPFEMTEDFPGWAELMKARQLTETPERSY